MRSAEKAMLNAEIVSPWHHWKQTRASGGNFAQARTGLRPSHLWMTVHVTLLPTPTRSVVVLKRRIDMLSKTAIVFAAASLALGAAAITPAMAATSNKDAKSDYR
jgi:hypothetical protein